ncbi:hypothetical protein EON65_57215 [archaeon]|nr:MAG: hypothetical protein EON65_57215 [archaeon]
MYAWVDEVLLLIDYRGDLREIIQRMSMLKQESEKIHLSAEQKIKDTPSLQDKLGSREESKIKSALEPEKPAAPAPDGGWYRWLVALVTEDRDLLVAYAVLLAVLGILGTVIVRYLRLQYGF